MAVAYDTCTVLWASSKCCTDRMYHLLTCIAIPVEISNVLVLDSLIYLYRYSTYSTGKYSVRTLHRYTGIECGSIAHTAIRICTRHLQPFVQCMLETSSIQVPYDTGIAYCIYISYYAPHSGFVPTGLSANRLQIARQDSAGTVLVYR